MALVDMKTDLSNVFKGNLPSGRHESSPTVVIPFKTNGLANADINTQYNFRTKDEIRSDSDHGLSNPMFKQPFILNKIGSDVKLIDKYAGRNLPVGSTTEDVFRIGKFILSPNGLLFTAKQFGLQAGNAMISTRIYNPLSLGSIDPFTHISRNLGEVKYEDSVKSLVSESPDGKNWMQADKLPNMVGIHAGLYSNPHQILGSQTEGIQFFKKHAAEMVGGKYIQHDHIFSKSTARSNISPIDSAYVKGVSRPLKGLLNVLPKPTDGTEFSQVNTSDNKYTPNASKQSLPHVPVTTPYKSVTSVQSKPITDDEGSSRIREQYEKMPNTGLGNVANMISEQLWENPTDLSRPIDKYSTLSYGNIIGKPVDKFYEKGSKSTRTNFGRSDAMFVVQRGTSNDSLISKYQFGDQGKPNLDRRLRSNRLTGTSDSMNLGGLNYGDDIPDLVRFKVEDVKNGTYLRFRATLEGISETISPSWNSNNYIGKHTPVYMYTGTTRELSFSFKMAAHSRQELLPIYDKLNYFVGMHYPTITDQNRMIGTIVKLTIGNLYKDTYGFFSSLSITWPDDIPWEIDDGIQVPMMVELSCGFTVIGNRLSSAKSINYEIDGLQGYPEDGGVNNG